jgi:hypothetical protein
MAKKILVRPLGYHPLLVMKIELIKRLTNGILTSLETTNLFSYNARCDHHEFFRSGGIFAKNHTQARYTPIIHCAANGNPRFVNLEVGYATTRTVRAIILVGLSIQ